MKRTKFFSLLLLLSAASFSAAGAAPESDEKNMQQQNIVELIPGDGLTAVPVKDGLTLLQDIQEYRVGYQFTGKPACWMPAGWGGNFTIDTGVAFQPMESRTRKGFLLQSPWRGGTGRSWVDYKLALPATGKTLLSFGIAMAEDKSVQRHSDGVTFTVSVFDAGKQEVLLNRHYNSPKWLDSEFDLKKYAGKTVVIRFEVSPGPKNSASFDWSCISQPRIMVEQGSFNSWKAPVKEMLSQEYQVEINGQPVDVLLVKVETPEYAKFQKKYQLKGGNYSFLQFDLSKPVRLRIRAKRDLSRAQVLPLSKNVPAFPTGDNSVELVIDRPMQLSFETDGRKHPLLIFANPEFKAPDPKTPGLIFYGPGLHRPKDGKIVLKDNSTLCLAGGAVVQAGVIVSGKNIRICGRGILDGTPWPWRKGPTRDMLPIQHSSDVTIEGIVIQNAWHWTLPIFNSRNIRIDNIKLCCGKNPNDDGINPCNAQNIQVRNSFIHTFDDSIAPKGIKRDWGNVENIRFENMVLWCDVARAVLLGHESQAQYMRNFVFRDIDIIHFNKHILLLQPGEDMKLENIVFKNVRINGADREKMVYAALITPENNRFTWLNAGKTLKKVPGHIKDIRFEDVSVHGGDAEKSFIFSMQGKGPGYMVEDVLFKNVFLNGLRLQESSRTFYVGGSCRNVRTEGAE